MPKLSLACLFSDKKMMDFSFMVGLLEQKNINLKKMEIETNTVKRSMTVCFSIQHLAKMRNYQSKFI